MEETRFEIVLTDVSMPEMGGLELLTEIRDGLPDSRVVVPLDAQDSAIVCLPLQIPTTPLGSSKQSRPPPQPHKISWTFDAVLVSTCPNGATY